MDDKYFNILKLGREATQKHSTLWGDEFDGDSLIRVAVCRRPTALARGTF